MKDFLSREMASNRSFDTERANRFVVAFERASKVVVETVQKPFRPRGLLNAATMEAVMVSMMEHGENANFTNEKYEKLLLNAAFLEMITSNTSNIENVKSRKTIADETLFGDE